jgi:hypothetical protein
MYATVSKTTELENIPFYELTNKFSKLYDENRIQEEWKPFIEKWATNQGMISRGPGIFNRAMIKIAELPLTKNENGLISGNALFKEIRQSPFLSGILLMFKYSSRGKFIADQTGIEGRIYCSLVPIVMAAFKKHHEIPYSAWDRNEIRAITEENLADAMLCTLPEISKEDVLEARRIALTPLIGRTAGIENNPATTYKLYLRKESGMSGLPTLAKIMMCQTWCAHPINRNNWMILNPQDWDNVPEELISTSTVSKTYKPSDASYAYAGWNLSKQ